MKLPAVLFMFILGVTSLGLSACGQKGPLFLPKEQPEQGGGDKAKTPAATNKAQPAIDAL